MSISRKIILGAGLITAMIIVLCLEKREGFAETNFAETTFMQNETADRVIKAGVWELRLTYQNKGTRSESQHGVLLKNGREVKPKKVGQVIKTDLGAMKFYLLPGDKKHLWENTGWNFADEKKIVRWLETEEGKRDPQMKN